MNKDEPILLDQTTVTDITIRPDGRIFLFGTSRQILEVMEQLNPQSPVVRQVLDHIRTEKVQAIPHE
jgi:hypothetical protein